MLLKMWYYTVYVGNKCLLKKMKAKWCILKNRKCSQKHRVLKHFCEPPLVAVHCKQKNFALQLDSVATEDYLSATVLSPHSCIVTDSSCVWQIGRDFRRRMQRHDCLFWWLKAADETHHSDVNEWAFFGFRALRAAFGSHDGVTGAQVQLWSKCTFLI